MGISQWHMNRLGLVDFWCYENDEFLFQDGHMLLRGSNGSGKSVTMQSFIPLLLDGNRSSERLDPFGTRSRKMDTYLIDENSDREERIGYLYLEFKRTESELYKTIGMGMRARKNKPLEVWYFVIEDNRRINIDFSLMEHHYTLTKKQLENIIGNQLISSQGEYMRKVNEALFGFPTLEDYKDAIDLLLQLRSPKLSNSLSPSKINEILAKSLQPLSEEDLRPMSDAITSMDNLQDELENLNNSLVAAKKIATAYDIYNKAILVDKWNKFNRENSAYEALEKDIQEKQQAIVEMEKKYQDLLQAVTQNRIRLEVISNEKNVLMDPSIQSLHNEVLDLKKCIQDLTQHIIQRQQQYNSKDEKTIDLKNDIENYQNQIFESQRNQKNMMKSLENIYDAFPFSEHSALKVALSQNQDFDFRYTKQRLKEELKETQNLINDYYRYENKQQQISTLEDQIIQLDIQMDNQKDALEQAHQKYHDCVNEYQEYFYHYANHNQVLHLSDKDLSLMVNILADYECNQDYHSIYEIVHNQYINQYESLTKEKGILQLELYQIQDEYDKVNIDYQEWLKKQDFEPHRDEYTLLQRQRLKDKQIAYVPLFQLLDFDESLSNQQKNNIEEILMQMHILDAIVVEEKNKSELLSLEDNGHDYYLWSHCSLNDIPVIKITDPFSTKQLSDILETLGVEVNHDFVVDFSYFKNGLLEGNISQKQSASFIGYERRQLLRKQRIDELSKQCEELQQKIEQYQAKIENHDKSMIILKQEMDAFQSDLELKQDYEEIEKYQKALAYLEQQMDSLLEQKKKAQDELQSLVSYLKQQCSKLFINFSKEAMNNRKTDIEDYEKYLDLLMDAILQNKHNQQLLDIEQEKLEELLVDIDNLKYEIDSALEEKQVCVGKVETLEKKLDSLGYAQKQKRLEEIDAEIEELQLKIERDNKSSTIIETQKQNNQELITQAISQLEIQKQKRDIYHDILTQEVQYDFLVKDDEQVYKSLKTLSTQVKLNKPISEYLTSLQSVFFEQASYLSQYHLTYEVDALTHEQEDVSGHFVIHANHQSKKIPFLELLIILQERIESQRLLIMKEDRMIFEEILANTIGKKIRQRIQTSRRWVDKMERYMHDMNTSSGLQLGLKWRSKKAIDDDELDTQKLVELLEKDYRILKESDRQKISQHFRSKIASARQMSLDENTSASFHQLIKEVMDYRQWFEFTLYAKKPNENRKELTNRIFYSYSGGEKAIAMYVPLFSAVAAKFESAKEDAPHLIALDEAFAGVDEKNIDTLFELITKFNFDYIMNSQVLWGDYPSCKSLAIYELFRPNNAPYVTKVAYVWNGLVRKVQIS